MPFEREAPGSYYAAGPISKERRSLFGRVFRGIGWLSAGPVGWVGLRGISRGASFIRNLATVLRAGAQRHPRFRASEDGGDDPEATAFLHGISLFELERRLKVRAAANRAHRLRDFCSGLHLLDGVDLRGVSVSVDRDACHSGARVFAILRSVLSTGVLQCATELSDPSRSQRGLARVPLYGQVILASLRATPLQKCPHQNGGGEKSCHAGRGPPSARKPSPSLSLPPRG